jgi:hypothetical protein
MIFNIKNIILFNILCAFTLKIFPVSRNINLHETTTLLDQNFLTPDAKNTLLLLLSDIANAANFSSPYSSIFLLKETQKYNLISSEASKTISYKNFITLISTKALTHIIRQNRLKEGLFFTPIDHYDFAQSEYETFITSATLEEGAYKAVSRYYSNNKKEKTRNYETIIKLSELIKELFAQESIDSLSTNYSLVDYSINPESQRRPSCHDLFYSNNVPDSNSSRLFHEAQHFSLSSYGLPLGTAQINMTTYSWKIGRLLASESIRDNTNITSIKQLANILVLGDISQKVCDKSGYFYSANELERLISAKILQHEIVDYFLFTKFYKTSLSQVTDKVNLSPYINSIDDLETEQKKHLLKSWLVFKNNDGSYNKDLIKKLGDHNKIVKKLTDKLDHLYLSYLSKQQTALVQQQYTTNEQLENRVLSFSRTNNYYTPSWNPSSINPQGYPLRPIDTNMAMIWDYFVMFARNSQEYTQIISGFTAHNIPHYLISHPIATAIPYPNNHNPESHTVLPQALPVAPSAPSYIYEK